MLTMTELAAHYRVSEKTVSRMVADGCPSRIIGRRPRFVLAEVEEWTKERACRIGKTPQEDGTPKLRKGAADAFTVAARRVQLRAMPSG